MRALVVDDHPLIQDAVSNVLRRLEPEWTIEVAADCETGLHLAGEGTEPALVLLDLNLPGISGLPAVKLWRTRFPTTAVVVLSATTDPATVVAAMNAGVAGFIPKSSSNEVMLNALRLVLAGSRYLPPEILLPSSGTSGVARRSPRTTAATLEMLGLSSRQIDVLRLIAVGAPNKIICRELGLAERTVKSHITAIFRALKVTSRTQAAIEASKLGLVDPERQ